MILYTPIVFVIELRLAVRWWGVSAVRMLTGRCSQRSGGRWRGPIYITTMLRCCLLWFLISRSFCSNLISTLCIFSILRCLAWLFFNFADIWDLCLLCKLKQMCYLNNVFKTSNTHQMFLAEIMYNRNSTLQILQYEWKESETKSFRTKSNKKKKRREKERKKVRKIKKRWKKYQRSTLKTYTLPTYIQTNIL